MDYRIDTPGFLVDFLSYHENICGHSQKTVNEYYLDIRTFLRFIKRSRGLVPKDTPFEEISIRDVDVPLVASIELREIYAFLSYLSRDRAVNQKELDPELGLNASSRARKIAAIKSFYKYMCTKAGLLKENPAQDLESPKQKKNLPRYLALEDCLKLLNSIKGENAERDFCIIMIFLNCGLRISELVGLNVKDAAEDHLRVLGKGNKVRMVYVNEATKRALTDYMVYRSSLSLPNENAMFLSRTKTRLTVAGVHYMIKRRILAAGLDPELYSAHKLRHTAATLMLKYGVDVRTIQEVLGHEHLSTTEIYTHIDNAELRTAARANPLSDFKHK